MTEATKGVWAVVLACVVWGVSSLYYKMLSHVVPIEVLAHRTFWSFVFFACVLLVQRRISALTQVFRSLKSFGIVSFASLMIATNWFCFIYAIQVGRATEASFGYFVFPLVAVSFGVVLFQERLTLGQKVAIGLAVLAVLTLGLGQGVMPWIPLVLSMSFGIYSAVKKGLDLGPVVSVTAEVAVLLPISLSVLAFMNLSGTSNVHGDPLTFGLLMLSGPLTGMPLILFSYATKRVNLATIGILQYINPSLQFLCALLIFQEPFGAWYAIAFPMIWIALVIYSFASLRRR